MLHFRKNNIRKITRSEKAQQFENALLDEVRFNNEINSLWIRYRFDIKLPVDDYSKVIFERNEINEEYKKLKDFIIHFEENWKFES